MPPTLLQVGKWLGQPLAATSVAGQQPCRLLFVTDRLTGLRLLVDTGAEVSVVPPSRAEHGRRPDPLSLQAVNKTAIATYGTRSLTLDLGLRRTFRWIFIVANVKTPILGTDFLRKHNLLVDVSRKRLVDTSTHVSVDGIVSHTPTLNLTLLPAGLQPEILAILSEFPGVLHPSDSQQPVKHDVTHHITTTGPPVHARTPRLPPERLPIA